MIAKPSVLLPEPFGPIRACVSPRRIVRFTPRRIGLPSTATCRFVIFSVSVMFMQSTLECHWRTGLDDVAVDNLASNLLMIEQRFVIAGAAT